jgi:SAM-dependent methyltransferase
MAMGENTDTNMPPIQSPDRDRTRPEPTRLRQYLRRLSRPAWLGTLRRTTPLSGYYGYDRGTPIDRYYIGTFLEKNRGDIHGRVLEVKNSAYTDRYGTSVIRRDVLDINRANPAATVIADLSSADAVPADQFDCFILTQTLQFIYNIQAAVCHAHRILRPGGVLLATVPCVSRIDEHCTVNGDIWRFTVAACSRLFRDAFGDDGVTVQPCGNVLACIAFLAGMACEELSREELAYQDDYFPLVITVRAVKR